MDDLCLKIEIVLNECNKSLYSIERSESDELPYFKTIFEVSLIFVSTLPIKPTFGYQSIYNKLNLI